MERYVVIGIAGNDIRDDVEAWSYDHAVKKALLKTNLPALIHKYEKISNVIYINF